MEKRIRWKLTDLICFAYLEELQYNLEKKCCLIKIIAFDSIRFFVCDGLRLKIVMDDFICFVCVCGNYCDCINCT